MKTYRKIFSLLTPRERRLYVLMCLFSFCVGIFELFNVASILPFIALVSNPSVVETNKILSRIYAMSGVTDPAMFVYYLGFVVLALILVSQTLKALLSYSQTRFSRMREFSVTSRLMARYLGQPYVWFLRQNTTDMRKTLLQEVGQAVNGTLTPSLQLIAQSIVVLFLVALIIAVDPVVALVTVVVIGGAYAAVFITLRRRFGGIGRERVAANRLRNRVTADALSAIKTVKLAALEQAFLKRYEGASFRQISTIAQERMLGSLPRYFFEAVVYGGMVLLILFMLARGGGDFQAVLPTLALYAVAAARIIPAAQTLYRALNSLRVGAATLEVVLRQFRATAGAAPMEPVAGEPIRLREQVTLEGVRFAFPASDRPVLDGLDMTVRAGTTVGIVGGTGAGKTTAVDVLIGLLTPQAGCVRVDGTEIGPGLVRRWQRSIGYVPQSIFLLDDTVKANIAFGAGGSSIDGEAVERAARAAGIHDFVVTALPQGYDTKVGELGVRLSGGQRQRIGIARALYREPDLLVLDEATSALDNETERQVMATIHALKHRSTVVMIAHRLTTVRECDHIVFLENGRVRSQGRFETLVETDEAFRSLARDIRE
jgi:ABC-type multidrug transport system fused ATPase/permease subunit